VFRTCPVDTAFLGFGERGRLFSASVRWSIRNTVECSQSQRPAMSYLDEARMTIGVLGGAENPTASVS